MADHKILRQCPDCGRDLRRVNGDNGSEFLGCTGWPKCRHTESVPEYIRMIEAGARTLPGMDI